MLKFRSTRWCVSFCANIIQLDYQMIVGHGDDWTRERYGNVQLWDHRIKEGMCNDAKSPGNSTCTVDRAVQWSFVLVGMVSSGWPPHVE